MVEDAENKKFDLIITKSICRFARNTIDCLETVRKLKRLGIAIQFEMEAINTLTAESELMLSILSSVAEEELASISQNMRWSNQRRFKKGKFSVTTKRFLGYDKARDGNLIINNEQAAIVKRIFKDYLSGLGAFRIAKGLEADGFINISGKAKWAESSIRDILKNEKYVGDRRRGVASGRSQRNIEGSGEDDTSRNHCQYCVCSNRVHQDSILLKSRHLVLMCFLIER